jgi:hypothetical protein
MHLITGIELSISVLTSKRDPGNQAARTSSKYHQQQDSDSILIESLQNARLGKKWY